jgi:hypothetical protein
MSLACFAQEKKIEQWTLFINSNPRPVNELMDDIKATLGQRFYHRSGIDLYRSHILFSASEDEISTLFKNKEWFKKENLEKDDALNLASQKKQENYEENIISYGQPLFVINYCDAK